MSNVASFNGLGKMWRFINFQLRIWPHCARLLIKNRSTQVAAALSYQTIFGLVPLAIVIVMVFAWMNSSFNLGFSIKDLLYKQAFFNATYPGQAGQHITIADKIDEMVSGYFQNISTGSVTIVGLVFVIWAAIGMLITIESSFNDIYNIPKGRRIIQKIIVYWTLLTLSPLLIGAGIYATTYINKYNLTASFMTTISPVIPYLITSFAFFMLYLIIPNTRVKVTSALWGGAVAGLIWTVVRWGFGKYVTGFIPYNAMYGVMGLIPLTVFWIYLSWLIVLFGLQLTYTTQNIKSIEEAQAAEKRKTDQVVIADDISILNIIHFVWHEFSSSRAPVALETVSAHFNIPGEFASKILELLVTNGLLLKSADPRPGFVPAFDAEKFNLSEIAELFRKTGLVQSGSVQTQPIQEIFEKQKELLGRYNLRQLD
jgi:membrane protein